MPLRGPFDEPGDVGDDDLAVVGLDRPQVGLQRGERVVGDLRLGARQAGDERRLAGVGQADEADVGQQAQLQLDLPFLPGQPLLGQARRLPGRRREGLVAAPAGAPAGDAHLLARRDHVEARAVPATDLRAGRDAHDERVPVGAVLEGAHAVAAALRAEVPGALEELQVAQVVVAAQDDVAATAAVAAVGPALGHVGLTAEGHGAVAARATSAPRSLPCPRALGTAHPMNKTFVITGASTGIGAATARAAAEAGYRVVLAARSEDKLKSLAAGDRRRRRSAATSPSGTTSSASPSRPAAPTSSSPTPASAARAASRRATRRSGSGWS